MYFDQSPYPLRCEWGLQGIQTLAPGSDVLIVLDVISFTTSVDLALSRAAWVYPYRWRDDRSLAFAESIGAIAAVGSRTDPNSFSLAPSSMLRLPENAHVVLPSPNGATLSLVTGVVPTFAACLRNARAVAQAAAKTGERISVIPAGERWPDGSLRPALEDLIGAGAVIHHLPGERSPEAQAAEAVFLHYRDRLLPALLACGSGKEAADRGSRRDLELAADLDASPLAPRLIDGLYYRD
jgi:2-phosphosulfolactate phosphatase